MNAALAAGPSTRQALKPVLLLPDQILAAAWAHLRRVDRAGGNIATFSGGISARLAALRQRHFAVEDDVRRLNCVRVLGVKGVRAVLPDVCVKKSFPVQLAFQRFLIGGHFLQGCDEALRLLFLWTEYSAGNSRDHTAGNKPHGFRAQPILEAGNHRTFSRSER